MKHSVRLASVLTCMAALTAMCTAPSVAAIGGEHSAPEGISTLISLNADGMSSRRRSVNPDISADGAWVSFTSEARGLVDGETICCEEQVYRWSQQTGDIELVSRSRRGGSANGRRTELSKISADGRYVAFESTASNLVAKDPRDLYSGIYLRDMRLGTTVLLSQGIDGATQNGNSYLQAMSGDGRYIAFSSDATNIVTGDRNAASDIFMADRDTGTVSLVSAGMTGGPANGASLRASMSTDGRLVAFDSYASNIVEDDKRRHLDVFVQDTATGETTLESRAPDGTRAKGTHVNPALSGDGRFLAFTSNSKELTPEHVRFSDDVFLRDLETNETTLVSRTTSGGIPHGSSGAATVADDGAAVAFVSSAKNLVPGDKTIHSDVFLVDMATGLTTWVSRRDDGRPNRFDSRGARITPDGETVVFAARDRITAEDDNFVFDIYTWTASD